MVNSQRGSREVQHSYKVTVLYAVVGPQALSTVHTSEPLNNIGVISLTKGNGHCYLATCWINGSPMVKSQAMPYKQPTGQPLLLVGNHTNLSFSFGKLVGQISTHLPQTKNLVNVCFYICFWQAGRGGMQARHMRRLSCPSLSGQDILQAHVIAGK